MPLNLNNLFTGILPGDLHSSNRTRQVHNAAYAMATPTHAPKPEICHINPEVLALLGVDPAVLSRTSDCNDLTAILAGNTLASGSQPYAINYGGHQFGNWAGQLGDGRAINLGEINHNGQTLTLQLKGAGPTPFSRQGDGFAVLRSSVREHLCSEAMHYLGVPTTRSLALIKTGRSVVRDKMYDGNPQAEQGAIVARVSPSFIRFGCLELFAARGDTATLTRLLDYCLTQHFAHVPAKGFAAYGIMFKHMVNATIDMVIHWQRVGFVHGVMNTDNMSILGLTIDYGPYGWLEGYDPTWTPNTTDNQYKRYAFGNQAQVARWNLLQLANAIYSISHDAAPLETAINGFAEQYQTQYQRMMASKLGLHNISENHAEGIQALIAQLESALSLLETDYTLFFRLLANVHKADNAVDALTKLHEAFYNPAQLTGNALKQWLAWLTSYIQLIKQDTTPDQSRAADMQRINPKYVLRNYMAQLAIDGAEVGDYQVLNELCELLKAPYDEQPQHNKWFAKRPEWARHKVGCSKLSCSS